MTSSQAAVVLGLWCVSAVSGLGQQNSLQKPRVLLRGETETEISGQSSGIGGAKGGIVAGTASSDETISQHSEVWEAARRFMQDCPEVTITTDVSATFDYTVRLDTQKVPFNLLGVTALYQLIVLNPKQEPLFINRKDYLKREIKPACKAILSDWNAHSRAAKAAAGTP